MRFDITFPLTSDAPPVHVPHPSHASPQPNSLTEMFPLLRKNEKETPNFSEKQGEVKRAQVSGNLDAPEGGFDAIMQAIVCEEQIGWREKARKLLVFSTDAGFHYAGDGKLGGIVKPNDGICHLDSKGVYTHSDKQDYPSVSQINHKVECIRVRSPESVLTFSIFSLEQVKEHSVNIIFAVTEEQFSVYDRLQANIEGSFAGTLSADSSNIVELVKAQYQVRGKLP